jgi:hypothetical protein
MGGTQVNDTFDAARLIQWALQPECTPARFEEYAMLIERYLDRLEFRETVQTMAAGLGLRILDGVRRGYSLVVVPEDASAFAMPASEYRLTSRYSEDNRLLDGLIQVAIAALVYPRAADLLIDPSNVRNPITVDEVETALRQLVERLERAAHGQPDPEANAPGVYEAWRVYKNRASARSTQEHRAATFSTRRMIEYALEFLVRQRCFKRDGPNYQPLFRYSLLVQEYAASRMYAIIQRSLTPNEVA